MEAGVFEEQEATLAEALPGGGVNAVCGRGRVGSRGLCLSPRAAGERRTGSIPGFPGERVVSQRLAYSTGEGSSGLDPLTAGTT